MKVFSAFTQHRSLKSLTMATLCLGFAVGSGAMLQSVVAAEPGIAEDKPDNLPKDPDIVGYVITVEKDGMLVTGRQPDGWETAVIYGYKNAKEKIKIGTKLKVWSLAMAQSYPAQATAEKILVLNTKQPDGSKITRTEAVQKALAELKPGNKAVVTFIRDAAFDEKSKAWKIAIHVGQTNDEDVTAFEVEVSADGSAAKKTEKPLPKKQAQIDEKPDRVLNEEEAIASELALIAKEIGGSNEDAAAVIKAQAAFGDIIGEIVTQFPNIYCGAVSASKPGDASLLYIKGPASPELQQRIKNASVKIKIIDNQPYSEAELGELQGQLHEELEKLGFETLGGYADFDPKACIAVTIREKEGLPSTSEGVLKLLSPKFKGLAKLTFQPVPTIVIGNEDK